MNLFNILVQCVGNTQCGRTLSNVHNQYNLNDKNKCLRKSCAKISLEKVEKDNTFYETEHYKIDL